MDLVTTDRLPFLGQCRVNLEHLRFHQPGTENYLDQLNIERLLSVYRTDKCRHNESWTGIKAVVTQEDWQAAIDLNGTRQEALQPIGDHLPSELKFPRGFNITCLTGQHRIAAGRIYLSPQSSWWIVNFYLADPIVLSRFYYDLSHEHSNEKVAPQGEIFRMIILYRRQGLLESEKKIMSWLSPHCRRCLKQVLKRRDIMEKFEKLADIPGLWRKMRLSTIHKILAMKADEVRSYLEHIYTTYDFILGGNKGDFHLLDPSTLEAVESKCPYYSSADRDRLEVSMQRNESFNLFTATAKQGIWNRICEIRYILPSLGTFLSDAHYLEQCAKVLKDIVPVPGYGNTINEALEHQFSKSALEGASYNIESKGSFRAYDVSPSCRFDIGQRQLWLWAMRNYAEVPLAHQRKAIHLCAKQTPNGIAQLVQKLSFVLLENEMSHDGGDQETQSDNDQMPAMTSHMFGATGARSGLPDIEHYRENRSYLYIRNMHTLNENRGRYLTAFFIRKCVYLAFFGNLDDGLFSCPTDFEMECAPLNRDSGQIVACNVGQLKLSAPQLTPLQPTTQQPQLCLPSMESQSIKISRFQGTLEAKERLIDIPQLNNTDNQSLVATIIKELMEKYNVTPFLLSKAPLMPDQCFDMAMKNGRHIVLLSRDNLNMADPQLEEFIHAIKNEGMSSLVLHDAAHRRVETVIEEIS